MNKLSRKKLAASGMVISALALFIKNRKSLSEIADLLTIPLLILVLLMLLQGLGK